MKPKARKTPTPRKWTRRTNDSVMISIRAPMQLADRLRAHVDDTGRTITDVVIDALEAYLGQEGGQEG